MTAQPKIILASTSTFRQAQLEPLIPGLTTAAPGTDESRLPGEAPADLAARLADEKALAVSARSAGALVIGGDQLATLDGNDVLGKPGTVERARDQLRACSGRVVTFYTAVSIARDDAVLQRHTDCTRVYFRQLDDTLIDRYIEVDQPLNCAGSFKSEGAGAVLFEKIESSDPAAIIGIPKIWLAGALRSLGANLP